MKKKFLPLCVAAVLSAGLVACGGSGDDGSSNSSSRNVSMEMWIPNENVAWAEERIEEFKERFTDTTYDITVTPVAEGDALTEIGKAPEEAADVFHFAGDHLGKLVDSGYIMSFPDDNYELLSEQGFSTAGLDSGTYNSKLYGIPFTPNSYFMYYDASIVTDPAKADSLDELLELGKVYFDIDNGWYQTAFWYGAGVQLFGPNGTDPSAVNFVSDPGHSAGRAIFDYINHPNFINGGDAEILANFKPGNGYVAAVGGIWLANPQTTGNLVESFGDDLRATILPTFTDKGNATGTLEYRMKATGDWKKVGVSSYTPYPVHAQRLAIFMSNAEAQQQRHEKFNDAPVIESVLESEEVVANMFVAALGRQTMEHVVRQPMISQMANFWTAAEGFANKIISGEVAAYDALYEEVAALQDNVLNSLGS